MRVAFELPVDDGALSQAAKRLAIAYYPLPILDIGRDVEYLSLTF